VSKDPAMRTSESNVEAKGMEQATAKQAKMSWLMDGVFEIGVAIGTQSTKISGRTRLEY
jgi:hypothetical protein